MNRSGWVAAVTLSLLLCGLSIPTSGQAVFGSVIGTITDPTGAEVAGAKVTITSQTKGTSVEAATNASGNYTVTHLIPDVYLVKVEAPGFKVLTFKDITISADADTRVDGQFQVGSTSEQVEVTAEAPQLKTDRADVSIEFNQRAVESLPVLNRNFTTFELMSPGTQKMVGWSHAATENPQGSQQIFVNGQHFSGTAYELDGTDNQDPILGIIVVNPNLDAITEAKMDLQNYDAEFGKAVAGVVTVQTKSGSNELHGGGFWFRRTDALAARDPFTQYPGATSTGPIIPHARWQQFGGSLGGPIIKDKLFFFGDYQGTRQANGVSNQLTIPTTRLQTSCLTTAFCDFSDYAKNIGNGTPGDPSNYIYDPYTRGAAADGSGRMAFCGPTLVAIGASTSANMANCPTPFLVPVAGIPSLKSPALSAAALKMLAAFPAPSNGNVVNNFIGSGAGPFSQNSFDTRIDFAAAPTVQIFGRFSLDYFSLSGKGTLGALGGVGFGPGGLAGQSVIHNYSLASGVTKTFSSTLLGDFRFGYFKYNPHATKIDQGTTPLNNFGIGANFPSTNLANTNLETSGLGEFDMDGTGTNFGYGLGVSRCNCPLTESEQQFQWVGNITKIHGNHQFKFGADVRYAQNLRVPSDANRAGVYSFSHLNTSGGETGLGADPKKLSGLGGLDFATFLLGDVTTLNRYVSTSTTAAERQHRMFYYGQDTWRATTKLTVNLGLRWEVYFPEYVNGKGQGGFANFVTGTDNVAGYGPFGLNGNIKNDWHYFAPRVGIAYQFNPKTVVRMGYGRSFDMGVFGSNFGHTVTQALPVLAAQFVQGAGTANYVTAFTLDDGPPPYSFPPIPASGQLPVLGPTCYFNSVTLPTARDGCLQPHARPLFQRLPTLDAWNATVQRQVSNTMTVQIAYIGNKGTHVFAGDGPTYNINQPSMRNYGQLNPATGKTFTTDERRPLFNRFSYPGFTDPSTGATLTCCFADDSNYLGNDASSTYEALQVQVERRMSQGLQLFSHYTFSHAYKYDSNYFADDPRVAYGPDDQARRHVWVLGLVYDLPFGRGKSFAGNSGRLVDTLIGGWEISSSSNWSSGLNWTPQYSKCNSAQDVGVCRPNTGVGSFRTSPSSFDPVNHVVTFFSPLTDITTPAGQGQAFADPGSGNLGNVGFGSFWGPRSFTADMAALKNFKLTERFRLQFRMDAFNVFNHPVLGFNNNQTPNNANCIDCGVLASGGPGKISDIESDASPGSTTGMRQLEFALRVIF
jgi:outer membrane receptor protein involved in Fe transport